MYNAESSIAVDAPKDVKHEMVKAKSFIQDISLYKLFWIFMISSVLGYLIETVWCLLTTGEYQSRQGLIYGPFSPIYGFGAILLTLCVLKISKKNLLYIFLLSALIGAMFEYACSLFQQVAFGTVSWEYSHSQFNIDGRTNLKYAFFWGVFGLFFVKDIYPRMCKLIDKIPNKPGLTITWILLGFMIFNFIISAVAVDRRTERYKGIPASGTVDKVIDKYYTDEFMQKVYPNMKYVEE